MIPYRTPEPSIPAFDEYFCMRRQEEVPNRVKFCEDFIRGVDHRISQTSGLILEISGGIGELSRVLAKRYPDRTVVCTDVDTRALKIAKENQLPNLRVEKADVYDLHKYYGQVGFAITISSLHHFDDLNRAMSEIARTLSPESTLYFADFFREFPKELQTPIQVGSGVHRFGDYIIQAREKLGDAAFVQAIMTGRLVPPAYQDTLMAIIKSLSYAAAYTPGEVTEAVLNTGLTLDELRIEHTKNTFMGFASNKDQ